MSFLDEDEEKSCIFRGRSLVKLDFTPAYYTDHVASSAPTSWPATLEIDASPWLMSQTAGEWKLQISN